MSYYASRERQEPAKNKNMVLQTENKQFLCQKINKNYVNDLKLIICMAFLKHVTMQKKYKGFWVIQTTTGYKMTKFLYNILDLSFNGHVTNI